MVDFLNGWFASERGYYRFIVHCYIHKDISDVEVDSLVNDSVNLPLSFGCINRSSPFTFSGSQPFLQFNRRYYWKRRG